MNRLAFIGGSGIYDLEKVSIVQKHDIETPFGSPSGAVVEAQIDGVQVYFLARHGLGHVLNPSEVNYRANIYALKLLGADTVVSISAVGSLKEEYAPTHFVLPDQFIDWTKGLRKRTFFEDGAVGHVSCARPIDINLLQRLETSLKQTDIQFSVGGTYVCIEGPQFSTKAESNIYRSFGADIIGMTNVPEAFLAKEAGMAYATVAMVTDYDCWRDEHCSVEEIMKVLGENQKAAQILVSNIVKEIEKNPFDVIKENTYAIISRPDMINESKSEILRVLLS